MHIGLWINMNELQIELGKCMDNFNQARNQLRKCIENAMNRGLSQNEIITVVDKYFANNCELCTAMILSDVLRYEFKDRVHPDYEK